MENFVFQNPTRIIFGKGQIEKIREQIPQTSKVLITYGGGSIFKNGVMDQVKRALSSHTVHEFGGIEPNPDYGTLMKAVEVVKKHSIDFILAVGGGSVLDGTKFIAAAARYEGDAWDILSKQAPVHKAVPLATVLTLPATGSESNGGAVISRRETGDKLAFGSNAVFPVFAVLDPETTYTLPTRQVTNGIVDAFVHITEQYLTYPVDAAVQDRFAEGLLLTLIEQGRRVVKEPQNYNVRANIMWAATLALNGLIGVGVPQDWATHMIGHEITAMHGVDHAQTLAIVLPALLKVQREGKREKLLQYAARVWQETDGSEDARIDAAIARTEKFFNDVGAPTRLSAYGIERGSIEKIVGQLEKHGFTRLGERGDLSLDKIRKILEIAF
jgi:NADP-dependent alcohol dehydrogenase